MVLVVSESDGLLIVTLWFLLLEVGRKLNAAIYWTLFGRQDLLHSFYLNPFRGPFYCVFLLIRGPFLNLNDVSLFWLDRFFGGNGAEIPMLNDEGFSI